MIEIIIHCTNENVEQLSFLISGYTTVLFNDQEFNFPICDVEVRTSKSIFNLPKFL
jgi:hypothetical protein